MSKEPSETSDYIEFDEQGRIIVRDLKVAERLLQSAARDEALEIVIKATMNPNLAPSCGIFIPPVPVNGGGCANSLCPLDGMLRFARPSLDRGLAEQWKDFRRDEGSGPARSG